MTFEQAEPMPATEAPLDAQAERVFYHTYVDHYGIAEHYVAGDLNPDDLEEFAIHLAECQECADRVLLAEMFRDGTPKRRGTVEQVISDTVREIVEQAHRPTPPELPLPTVQPKARRMDRPARKVVLSALAHSKKLGAIPPPLPTQIRAELKAPEPTAAPEPVALKLAEPMPVPQRPASIQPVSPVPANPLPRNVFLCTFDADQRGCRLPSSPGSGVAACPLPLRARWVASFSPLQLFLMGGAAALLLMAIPSGIFLLELVRLARN